MLPYLTKCPKCNQLWNTFPGAVNYCNHMGIYHMTTTEALLNERATTHGDYSLHASVTQQLKEVMKGCSSGNAWDRLDPCQAEALEMIAHKIGRILAGRPDFRDHWDDIAGYAKLVADRCPS